MTDQQGNKIRIFVFLGLIILVGVVSTFLLVSRPQVNQLSGIGKTYTIGDYTFILPQIDLLKLERGEFITVIVGVEKTGAAKEYWDAIQSDSDAVAKDRLENPAKWLKLESDAQIAHSAVKLEILSALPEIDYKDYQDISSIPFFGISVNEDGLEKLVANPRVVNVRLEEVASLNY